VFEELSLNRGSVSRVVTGDFNGDGISDLLITDNIADGSFRVGAGKAYVILGKRSFGSPASINLASQQPDLTVLGPEVISGLGYGACLGDLNGDGIDDIVLSAQRVTRFGRVIWGIYVIFGSRGLGAAVVDLARTPASVTVYGKVGELSISGLAVGDINGDGAKDLIFGVSGPETVSIMLGPFAPGTTVDLATTAADIVITGPGSLGGFGSKIAAVDVNGDQIADLLIGNPIFVGAVDIFMGSSRFERGLRISLLQTQSDVTIVGALTGQDFSGDAVGAVISTGDVNGDGINDILLGVPGSIRLGNGLGQTSAGETYVVFGSPTLAGRFINTGQGQQDLTIQGTNATAETNSSELGDSLGYSVAAADVDGDGVTDIVLGAPGAEGTKDRGAAYVVLGSPELTSAELIKTSETDQDITILGEQKRGLLGSVVASGDLNGDGVSDLILEADGVDNPSGSAPVAGAIYIYFGAKVRPPEITKAKFKKGKSQLQISGREFTGDLRVEINGVIINREVRFLADEGRLILEGTREDLKLGSDNNEVVVIRKGTRSNAAKVKG